MSPSNSFSILSIDGGGIRGIIPALVLAEIEERADRPIAELFDLVAGTSTGGILSLGLTAPGDDDTPRYSASDLVEFYDEEGGDIFQKYGWDMYEKARATVRSVVDEKYDADNIEQILKDRFGSASLSDALTPVLVPAYEIEQRRPYFFKSHRAKESSERDILMWKAARATSAAPTYFEPFKINIEGPLEYLALIDGGVYANNPAACALVEGAADFSAPPSEVFMLSVGTGVNTKSLRYEAVRDWGLLYWVRPLLDVVFDGVSDSVDYQLNALLNAGRDQRRYYRLQPKLDDATDAMDNASPRNLRSLKLLARDLISISDESDEIDAICEALT